jgi:hypothetical protein
MQKLTLASRWSWSRLYAPAIRQLARSTLSNPSMVALTRLSDSSRGLLGDRPAQLLPYHGDLLLPLGQLLAGQASQARNAGDDRRGGKVGLVQQHICPAQLELHLTANRAS